MPDTFTHIALPFLFSRWIRQLLYPVILLIGAVLPDYFREFFGWLLPDPLFAAVHVFHSLAGVILTSLILAALFKYEQRFRVWISLAAGQSIHLFLDLSQFYMGGGSIYLFLPWWEPFQIGLISESYWHYVFMATAGIFIAATVSYYIFANLKYGKKKADDNASAS